MKATNFFEIEASNHEILRGIIHNPEEWNGKVIVFVNGYRSSATDGTRYQRNRSLNLSKLGYLVVRFDYIGYGESDGDFKNANITSMVENTECVIEHIIKNYQNPEIILSGESMGGLVTLSLANKNKYDEIKKIILHCPALDFYNVYMNQGFKDGASTPMVDLEDPEYIKTWEEDLYKYKDQIHTYTFKGTAMIFHGDTDPTIPYKPIEEFANKFSIELKTINGVDHGFKQNIKGPEGIRKNFEIRKMMEVDFIKFIERG